MQRVLKIGGRVALGFAAAAMAVQIHRTAVAQDGQPPNILLVIADDMGLDASPCHPDIGESKPNMPVLAAMCQDGLVFDNVWAQPLCSPTRATILTGRYGFRTGVLEGVTSRSGRGIGRDETSLQSVLEQSGSGQYTTAVIGKWHLSNAANGGPDNPALMGVGHYSGLLRGALRDYQRFDLTTDGVTRTVTGYVTTVFTDLAIEWIATRGGAPWFLWLAYTAPHTPFHLPPVGLHDRDALSSEEAAIRADPAPYYFAALEALDHELGRLLQSLPQGQREDTVVIFIGDNGTPAQVAQLPYGRGSAKGTLMPGGIAVPMVVSGKGVRRHGEREAALINTSDLFATIAELGGATAASAEDSISFAPLLTGNAGAGRKVAYADLASELDRRARNNGWTIRDDRFQLLVLDDGRRMLFDLAADPGGQVDLLASGGAAMEAVAADLMAEAEALRGR